MPICTQVAHMRAERDVLALAGTLHHELGHTMSLRKSRKGDTGPGTYRGIDNPVAAAGMAYTTICGPFLSDEFMYQATKAVFENLPFIISASANFKQTKLENVYKGLPIPVHPGAARYYKPNNL